MFFSNCKKENTAYNLKGRIVLCYNTGVITPFANEPIDLFQTYNGGNYKSRVLGNTSTDAQGNFSFNYITDDRDEKLAIRASSGFGFIKIVKGIPVQNISDLKVYYSGRYNLVIGLNVTKPYTNSDTLYISDLINLGYIKKAGPFVSGRVSVQPGVALNEPEYENNKGIIYSGLNSNTNLIFNKEFIIENSKLCSDTVYVNLDIR